MHKTTLLPGDRPENAVINVIRKGKVRTADLGGNAGTLQFAGSVASKL
jgi:isocitrate/isopropylmalate dehydrogenase